MLIRLDNPALVEDLCAHYSRSGFTAESIGGGMVEVTSADAPAGEQERREVLMHLRVWAVTNPHARVELL